MIDFRIYFLIILAPRIQPTAAKTQMLRTQVEEHIARSPEMQPTSAQGLQAWPMGMQSLLQCTALVQARSPGARGHIQPRHAHADERPKPSNVVHDGPREETRSMHG